MADVANLSLLSVADPHGNGQPTVEVVYTDPDTQAVIHSGCFVSQHGGNLLRFVHGNPSPSGSGADQAGSVFELAPTPTGAVTAQVAIVDQGRVNISVL